MVRSGFGSGAKDYIATWLCCVYGKGLLLVYLAHISVFFLDKIDLDKLNLIFKYVYYK